VSDCFNERIRRLDLASGAVTTIAGTGEMGGKVRSIVSRADAGRGRVPAGRVPARRVPARRVPADMVLQTWFCPADEVLQTRSCGAPGGIRGSESQGGPVGLACERLAPTLRARASSCAMLVARVADRLPHQRRGAARPARAMGHAGNRTARRRRRRSSARTASRSRARRASSTSPR
jgi:hypothetical protein